MAIRLLDPKVFVAVAAQPIGRGFLNASTVAIRALNELAFLFFLAPSPIHLQFGSFGFPQIIRHQDTHIGVIELLIR